MPKIGILVQLAKYSAGNDVFLLIFAEFDRQNSGYLATRWKYYLILRRIITKEYYIIVMIHFTFVDLIDYIGTFAFAISGIRLASAKAFDLFGAFMVGMATAVGGGTLRDVMLGQSPFWMTQWIYFVLTGVALLSFVCFHRFINRISNTIFLFDTIGLALFTVVGFQKTVDAGFPFYAAILMGMLTGAAGGVIRDILINEVPLIFRSDIYALACFVGGLIYTCDILLDLPHWTAQVACAASVIIIRLLAVHYHWQLPILHDS